jgi:EAL domain-containing protein (putative c-di-GMP-specific phosphodiesterase class I)
VIPHFGGRAAMFAINLSGASINADFLIDFVKQQTKVHGIDPRCVCFEITETVAVNQLRRAAHIIKELKSMGFCFALDDFGSGMSSFAYLKNLPVDFLKIDGGFVREMDKDPVSRSMVAAINQIGHAMGLKTIAEWVENEAVLRELRAIGVDFAQGYAIGRPSPLPESAVEAGAGQPKIYTYSPNESLGGAAITA